MVVVVVVVVIVGVIAFVAVIVVIFVVNDIGVVAAAIVYMAIDKIIMYYTSSDCKNGQRQPDGGCMCDPCWKGPNCDQSGKLEFTCSHTC